ncbi:hypothetical protein Zm00014a_019601 [Zea mays]|uniref:Uncharacterized protein n=1 Tax=Zea mays TaxID=4577 RepID=A0A3L6D6C0_MAIZE|nr:hypothetical protein Zm00014a_019601 [Zea mays]
MAMIRIQYIIFLVVSSTQGSPQSLVTTMHMLRMMLLINGFVCNDSHVSLSSSQNVLSEKLKPFSTNGIGISSTSSSETSKIPLVKQDGLCSTKGNVLMPLKNGKTASGPLIKPIHLRTVQQKRLCQMASKPHFKNNPEVNETAKSSESNRCKTGQFVGPSKNNADNTILVEREANSQKEYRMQMEMASQFIIHSILVRSVTAMLCLHLLNKRPVMAMPRPPDRRPIIAMARPLNRDQ